MSDRINAITVTLAKDIREDDAEPLLNAIRMLKGVMTVTPHVADHAAMMAEERARRELGDKILAVIYPKTKGATRKTSPPTQETTETEK